MRIALFFLAFTLGVGVAAGLDAADAASRHRQAERQVSVVVPRSALHQELEVQPISFEGPVGVGDAGVVAQRPTAVSGWHPGAGEAVLAVVAVATLGAGLVVRRRVLLPARV
jgi:hypothetical protein